MDNPLQQIVLELRTNAEKWEQQALSSNLSERNAKLSRRRAEKSRLLASSLAGDISRG